MDKFSAYEAELDYLRDLNRRKSAGYAGQDNPDPWSNFRLSQSLGIEPYLGVLVRMSDKFARICSLVQNPLNDRVSESLTDNLRDLAAYALIAKILIEEFSDSNEADISIVTITDVFAAIGNVETVGSREEDAVGIGSDAYNERVRRRLGFLESHEGDFMDAISI